MQKKKIFKIEDSNIEGIGTDADKECRKSAAATEKAWKKIDKDKVGVYAWRIEKFKVKVNNDAKAGKLYNDDSYIFLVITKDTNDKIKMDIHFWLGATTSQDEAGTAAYKTVELDDYFGGAPIQHRECSDNESKSFVNLFPNGIRLLTGGVESGFNHVKPETFSPRLLWLKGKKNIRTTQIDIELANLNSGDVFVLDAGLMIYQYQGKAAGKNEKSEAGKLQRAIDDERKGKPEVVVFSQTEKPDEDMGHFFSYFAKDLKDLGISCEPGGIVDPEDCKKMLAKIPKTEGSDDRAYEKQTDKILMHLQENDGKYTFNEVAKGKDIKKNMLKSDDVFVFDIGCEVYVWIGKGASAGERKNAMKYATTYLKNYERPMQMPVISIYEGGENEVFESAFH